MTGKFHKTWGEFGGYKHPNALRYEVALSAANGAKCSNGDQLPPSGAADEATHALIGEAYKTIEEREPWLKGAKNKSDIAVLSNEAILNYYNDMDLDESNLKGSNAGCSRILLEGHYLFDMIDTEADFNQYKLLILPDHTVLDNNLTAKVNNYLMNGGKLLSSYHAGMTVDGRDFAINLGCNAMGESEYNPAYIRPEYDIPTLRNAAYIIYAPAVRAATTSGSSLGIIEKPYFNRTAEHFCSHRHSPTSGEKYCDAIICTQNTAYLSQQLFYEYFEQGNIYTKEIITKLIDRLLGNDISIRSSLPAQGILTLCENQEQNKELVHTLYASPVRRGKNIEIIEDIIPLYNVKVSVATEKCPKTVKLVPEGKLLSFDFKNGRVEFTIPKIDCWQITEIQY